MALIAMLRSTNSGARFSADTETAGADWRARRRAALPRLRGPPVAKLQRRLNYGYNEFAGIWRPMACMARQPRPPFGSESCRAGNCAAWPTTNQAEILGAS